MINHPYAQHIIDVWQLYVQSKVLQSVDYNQHMEVRKELGLTPEYNHNCGACRKEAIEQTFKKLME